MTGPRPTRRVTDHYHADMWTRSEQIRHEDQKNAQIAELGIEVDQVRRELHALSNRVTMMIGALGLLAFVLPIVAPIVWQLFNISVPAK